MVSPVSNEFQRMRLAYDLYGFVKLSNCFESWQLDGLEAGFDRIYEKNTGFRPGESKDRLPSLNYGVEEDFEFMRIVGSSRFAINALKAVAGDDCQYIAPDILCVYDDSIGAHRDTFYDFDVPKMLIFLSDCNDSDLSVPGSCFSRRPGGSFAVLSGSHIPAQKYSNLSAQLSDWPDPSMSVRREITPHFLRGDTREDGESYYPFFDTDSRYQGYSCIPFKRGDIVIFSTRALHALLPTCSNHFSKLIGLIFLEGYSKYAGQPIGTNIASMSSQEIGYLSTPYNLRMADMLTKGANFDDVFALVDAMPMGLVDQLALGDPLFNQVFEPLTSMYRLVRSDAESMKSKAYNSRESVMKSFHANFNAQCEQLDCYYSGLPTGEKLRASDAVESVQYFNSLDTLREEILSKNYSATPPTPTLTSSPEIVQANSFVRPSTPLAHQMAGKANVALKLAKQFVLRSIKKLDLH